jgi:hypothetical protein
MLSYLKKGLWGNAEKRFQEDFTLTLCGPDFSGKTTLFNTWVKNRWAAPWVTHATAPFTYHRRSFKVTDIAGDGLGRRNSELDILKDCIDPQNGMVVFVHDAANGDINASITLLSRYANEIIRLGGRFLFIVLSKQDIMFPVKVRWSKIQTLASAFEAHMATNFGSQIHWQVHTLDGFSGKSDICSKLLLDEIELVTRNFASFKPQFDSCKSPQSTSKQMVQTEGEGFNSKLDSETFWTRLKDGALVLETHVDKLRATYLTVLNAMENSQGMLDLVDEMQAMEERRSLGGFQRHR